MAKGETYEEFVAKFKKNAPKTTDDCYTPQPVYEVVKEYALKLAGLTEDTCTPVRPFYPGGDYRNYDYPPPILRNRQPAFLNTIGDKAILFGERDKVLPFCAA